jgi:hypothetical protein
MRCPLDRRQSSWVTSRPHSADFGRRPAPSALEAWMWRHSSIAVLAALGDSRTVPRSPTIGAGPSPHYPSVYSLHVADRGSTAGEGCSSEATSQPVFPAGSGRNRDMRDRAQRVREVP